MMQVSPCHTCLMLSIKYKVLLDRCILHLYALLGTDFLQSFPPAARKREFIASLPSSTPQPATWLPPGSWPCSCMLHAGICRGSISLICILECVNLGERKRHHQTYRRYRAFHSSSEWQKAYRNLHVDPRFSRECLSNPSRTRARISSGKHAHEPMLLRAFGPLARY